MQRGSWVTALCVAAAVTVVSVAAAGCAYRNHKQFYERRIVVTTEVPVEAEPAAEAEEAPHELDLKPAQPDDQPDARLEAFDPMIDMDGDGRIDNPGGEWSGSTRRFDLDEDGEGRFVVRPDEDESPAGPPVVEAPADEPEAPAETPQDEPEAEPAAPTPPAGSVERDRIDPTDPSARVLTKRDLIELAAAGVGDRSLLALIEVSTIELALDTATILELTRAGLSDEVVAALTAKVAAQERESSGGEPGTSSDTAEPETDDKNDAEPNDPDADAAAPAPPEAG
jgi:hypothetical protein